MTKVKKTTTGRIKACNREIAVRKSRPDEWFYRTGNAEHRYCICVQEIVSPSGILRWRYHPLKEPALHALIPWTTPVLFHELVSEGGEYFAYPQVLERHSSVRGSWREAEDTCLMQPLYFWGCFTYGDERDSYVYDLNFEMVECPSINPAFGEQLDEALRPDLIETLEHPIVLRLQYIDGRGEDAIKEWVCIG